jgi:hypothetical protein
VLENDVQAAEWLYGACKGLSDALYMALGTGIGGGMGGSTASRLILSKFLNGAGYLGALALAEITFKQYETGL